MWNFPSLLLLLLITAIGLDGLVLASEAPGPISRSGNSVNQTLDSCLLTVKGSINDPALPATVVGYGIFARFAKSNPSVNALWVRDSGTAGVWTQLGNNQTYQVGFAVESPEFSRNVLEGIVKWQWSGTDLFNMPVPENGNWKVLAASC